MYARQLAEQYNTGTQQRQQQPKTRRDSGDRYNESLQGSRVGRPGASPNPDDVPWRSFVDGMAPGLPLRQIHANGRCNRRPAPGSATTSAGFVETQKTVNGWISAFKKNFRRWGRGRPIRARATTTSRAAGSTVSICRQPTQWGDPPQCRFFNATMQICNPLAMTSPKLELRAGEAPPRTSSRPLANPNLFKPGGPDRRPSSANRKVSFQAGPPEEIKTCTALHHKSRRSDNKIE